MQQHIQLSFYTDSAVTVASILSVPVLQGDGSTLGVLTMGRNASEPQFASEDEEIISGYLTWAAVALFSDQEQVFLCLMITTPAQHLF